MASKTTDVKRKWFFNRLWKWGLPLCILVVAASQHRYLQRQIKLIYQPRAVVEWQQPSALNSRFSPISNERWNIDYLDVEPLLQRARYDSRGALVLDPNTLKLLETIVSKLAARPSEDDMGRMVLLMTKSADVALKGGIEQLILLLSAYYAFRDDYEVDLRARSNARGKQKLVLLRSASDRYREMQQRHFGNETAQRLFTAKNRRVDYLLARQIINFDPELDAAQKQAQLERLQSEYQQRLP